VDWKGKSKAAKRFIANLLHTDPEVRMTAEECMEHAWLADLKPRAPLAVPPPVPRNDVLSPEVKKPTKPTGNGSGRKLKGVWRVMTKRKGAIEESENVDDSKSTSSKTASLLSSNATGSSAENHTSSK
jgi:serine/threonine protein kinase